MQTRTAAEQIRHARLHQPAAVNEREQTTMATITATRATSWTRARMALSLGVTGLVLSLAAAGAGGAFDRGQASPDTATPASSTSRISRDLNFAKPTMTYFLVDSLK